MKTLTPEQIIEVAAERGYNAHSVRAVQLVEAGGSGFLKDGRPKILFERHWFHRLTGGRFSVRYPDISNPKAGGYIGGAAEWQRLDKAVQLDRTAALKSASYGIGQIMGFNHRAAGFDNVQDMVNAAFRSEAEQLRMMLSFIANNPVLDAVMRLPTPSPLDWQRFAKGYNGAQFAKNQYDLKLASAYAKCLRG